MRKSAVVLSILCLIMALAMTALLFACQPTSGITLVIEGEPIKGAVCQIYADVRNIDDYSGIEFSIEEDYDWVSINGDKLLFSKNAEVGKTVTVSVHLGKYEDKKSITVKPTPVTSLTIDKLPYFNAGDIYDIPYIIEPDYATDAVVSFEVVEGKNLAYFEGTTLHIDESCDYTDNITIRATAGGKTSEIVPLYISTVQPKTLEIVADKIELKRGEQTKIKCNVTPSNCTLGNAELDIPESEYYDYIFIAKEGVITIKDNAPVGEIDIKAKLGKLTSSLKINIVKTPVERVEFTSSHTNSLQFGDVVELRTAVIPQNATDPTVNVSVLEGAEYIDFDKEKLTFKVTTKEISKLIVLVAEADGKRSNLAFTTTEVKAQNINVSVNGSVSVSVGEERIISATVIPQEATNKDVSFEIVLGSEYAVLQDNKIKFNNISVNGKTEVKVKVQIDDIEKYVIFYIVPIPTESVVISTNDKTTELLSGDKVVFNAVVYPENASYGNLTYFIESGEKYGYISDNEFTVNNSVGQGCVVIYAQTDDGIKSNSITLEIFGSLEYLSPKNWASIDKNPSLFDGLPSVKLDLTSLPLESDYTTVIISDDVNYLEIYGGYDGADFVIKNLNFYFLTTDYIDIRIENLAILADGGFNDYIFDFGNYATVHMDIVGNNYIEAASTYMPNSFGFTVDGVISGASNDYLRKRGMDGFPGLNGGTCINAYNIEISGKGDLTLVAGSGSNGTDATNGANSPDGTFAGLGGDGGYGGNSGYAIFSNVFTCNVKGNLSLIGGNGGIGGKGGLGGTSANSSYNGSNGSNGADGEACNPIFTASTFIALTNNYTVKTGIVQSNSKIRSLELDKFINTVEKYYNISIHYNSTYMPHNQYSVKALNSTYEVTKMMYALDYSLSTFPKNLYLEIMQKTKNKINIYFMESVTRKLTNSVIYGLTSTINNVWFATFDTTLRGIYYSTPFNIMTHELLHVLTFTLDDKTDDELKTNVPKYNLGNPYRTNSNGVYDPEKGYNGDNSVFLCAYSKSNYSEDISDNLSMIGMLVKKPEYLIEGKPFYEKVVYITSVYVSYYDNLTPYTILSWEKFI